MDRVTMPQLGETVVEGTILRWFKAEGDAIGADEPLFEVSTDKVDAEVPSAFGGFVRRIVVAEGETVPIGATVALIAADLDEPLDDDASADLPPAPAPASAPAPAPASTSGDGTGSGATRGTSRPSTTAAGPDGVARGHGAALTPVVRRLLDEHGLDPATVNGSGRDGRITRADVLAAAANRSPGPGAGGAAAGWAPGGVSGSPAGVPGGPVPVPGPDDTVVPFSRSRRATAEHMVRSRATSAHALVTVDVDYAAIDRVRSAAGLSYLPFVARAVLDGLREFPHLNASVGDDCLIVHPEVHLGLAVDVGEALMVPVVRSAADRRLSTLAEAFADVAARARASRLTTDELTGATFTLTNVGSYGTVLAVPIINQPQVAILSTDGVEPRPVATKGADGEWAVTVHPVGNLSLSFDHRAVDGAYAAAFLAAVRTILETRVWADEL